MHCNFEPAVQWGCLRDIIRIVRTGDIDRNAIVEALQHGACFIGCAAAMNVDDYGDSPRSLGTISEPTSIQEICDALEGEIPADGIVQFDWSRLLQVVVPLLLKLLDELLNRDPA